MERTACRVGSTQGKIGPYHACNHRVGESMLCVSYVKPTPTGYRLHETCQYGVTLLSTSPAVEYTAKGDTPEHHAEIEAT